MSKPTIVACAGAWHSPAVYDTVLSQLQNCGYQTVAQTLPSLGGNPPVYSFDPDVMAIRDTLTKLIIEEEKDAVLVMHSFSGFTGLEAPVGLGKKEREQKGQKGGVVRLVYIAAFVPPEGWNPIEAFGGNMPPWVHVDEERGVLTVSPTDAIPLFYSDFPPDEAEEWAAQLEPQSLGPYHSYTTYAAWRHMPSTFVIPKNDQSLPNGEAFMESMVQAAKSIEPTAFDVVEKIPGGHSVMISRPEIVAEVLRRAAGEKV